MAITAPTFSPPELAELNARFESADPREVVQWAVETFGDGLSVGASFGGASGMAILHMAAQLKPNVHVFDLDTDYLFEETHETMRTSVPALGLQNVNVYKTTCDDVVLASNHAPYANEMVQVVVAVAFEIGVDITDDQVPDLTFTVPALPQNLRANAVFTYDTTSDGLYKLIVHFQNTAVVNVITGVPVAD